MNATHVLSVESEKRKRLELWSRRVLAVAGAVAMTVLVNGKVLAATKEEANKQAVLRFYEAGLNKLDYVGASRYFGDRYIQHNPTAKDGPLGFKGFVDSLRREHPHTRVEIVRVIAEGDFVVLHVHAFLEPGDPGLAIVDIYRLDHRKIVEHWDVIQPVPDKSANPNGMFGPNAPNAGLSERTMNP
jgi:predicted SnoaL-like aldol condensation-catalyzing enzyme